MELQDLLPELRILGIAEEVIEDKDLLIAIVNHIATHKWLVNENIPFEITCRQAAQSWYELVYHPIASLIEQHKALHYFKANKSKTKLFVEICDHWHLLTQEANKLVFYEDAFWSYIFKFADKPLAKLQAYFHF